MKYKQEHPHEPTASLVIWPTFFGRRWKVVRYHGWDWTGDEGKVMGRFDTKEEAQAFIDQLVSGS